MSQTQASATIEAPLADVNTVISDLPKDNTAESMNRVDVPVTNPSEARPTAQPRSEAFTLPSFLMHSPVAGLTPARPEPPHRQTRSSRA